MPDEIATVLIDSLPSTTLPIANVTDTGIAPSLFKNHLLEVKYDASQYHITEYSYLLSGIFLILFAAFVWLYVSNRKKLEQVVKDFYQTRFTNQNKRDEFFIGSRISIFLSTFFVFTITIFITQVIAFYDITVNTTYSLPIVIAILIIIVYGLKFLAIALLGAVFQVQRKAKEYITSIFLFCNVLGLFMLPLVVCLTFMRQVPSAVFIYAGIALIAFFILIRMVRGAYIGLKSPKISKIYLFMYLCALEILPIILMVKIFSISV